MSKKQIVEDCYINDGWEGLIEKSTNMFSSSWTFQELLRMLYGKAITDSVDGKKVLDIGGSDGMFLYTYQKMARGFGNKILYYVNVDMRQDALDKLNEKRDSKFYGPSQSKSIFTENINFLNNVDEIIKKHGKFDIIIAYEVIEHFDIKYADLFIKNMEKCLNPNGKILLSTPIHHTQNEELYYPDDHPHEFYYGDLVELLKRHFIIDKEIGNHIDASVLKSYMRSNFPEDYKTYKKLLSTSKMGPMINSFFAMIYPEISKSIIFVLNKKQEIKYD